MPGGTKSITGNCIYPNLQAIWRLVAGAENAGLARALIEKTCAQPRCLNVIDIFPNHPIDLPLPEYRVGVRAG